MRFVKKETGAEAKEGDTLIDFRGEDNYSFITITREGKRVYVYDKGVGFAREFYPQVFPEYEIRE